MVQLDNQEMIYLSHDGRNNSTVKRKSYLRLKDLECLSSKKESKKNLNKEKGNRRCFSSNEK